MLLILPSIVAALLALGAPAGNASQASAQQGQCPAGLTMLPLSLPPEGPANITATVSPEVTLAAPGEGGPGSYFIAWVLDLDASTVLPLGSPVPHGNPKISYSGDRTQNFDGSGAGDHMVTAVLIGYDGIPCSPLRAVSATFKLQGPLPPTTGTSALSEGGERFPPAHRLGLALLATSGAALAVALRRR